MCSKENRKMTPNVRTSRISQITAWAVASLFVLGFFFHSVGMWTGPILGVWFVGTQKPRRGFLWLMAFTFIPDPLFHWRSFPLTSLSAALAYLGWMLLGALLSVLPLIFHRLISPRLPGFLSTLPFPLAAIVFDFLVRPLFHIGTAANSVFLSFLLCWFAATIVWLWNREIRTPLYALCAGLFVVTYVLVDNLGL